ncbi:hypothetical protein F4809DRAFT_46068 [Biscogniauxia mediterranea]|nr:hypothetical protein F4809DRAFT_46068 [Biscogniauxia mediterranea]
MRPPMRSSIACTRCRKSKIKCENHNGTSPCDSCIKTGKDCVFKVPDPPPPKRSEPPSGVKQERDGGSDRKKLKKIDDISKVDNQRASMYAEEVLAAPFLTEDLWEQILDLYKLHFAPELPFLHLPTVKERLGRRFRSSQPEENDPDFNLVLLGVLTLTARFHPDLVKYLAHICNSQPGNARTRPVQTQLDPAAASEYYADILAMALGPLRTAMGVASTHRVSALLMLGLYEWGQTQPKTGGITAWMYVGAAIRMAQFLALGFGDAQDATETRTRGPHGLQSRSAGYQSQLALNKEIQRRIMFSCFILDRMLSCGKHRVSIIQRQDLQIQLPCSEDKFDLAMEVQTGYLMDKRRQGTDDSVLSRFIQLVDIWGDISKFSSRGGRLTETYPPWDDRTTFYRLNEALEEFDMNLPGTFTFSRSNYFKHENHQASSVYVLLHMLRCVCLIMLHREYVPFVPIRCKEPEGPLDSPVFPKEEYEPPSGWWRESAIQLFKAARDIVDLIEICQRKDKLPQSTIVLFAIWNAAFVGLYGFHFPQMDTERHMLSFDYEDTQQDDLNKDPFKHGPTALTFQSLHKMSTWLKMASTYVGILRQMDKYFETIKQDYYKFAELNQRTNKTTLRVREGGTGGGLEEYRPLVKQLKDFGTLHPEEQDHVDISERSRASTLDPTNPDDVDSQNNSAVNSKSTSAPPSSFTAINHSQSMAAPKSNRPFSRAAGSQGAPSQPYADSWRYHNSTPQPQSSPAQAYPTPGTMFDTASIAAQAHDRTVKQDESEGFWICLKKEEPRRFGTTGDLGLFSTGESQLSVSDMPFGDSSYIPVMDISYQFLQQADENYEDPMYCLASDKIKKRRA